MSDAMDDPPDSPSAVDDELRLLLEDEDDDEQLEQLDLDGVQSNRRFVGSLVDVVVLVSCCAFTFAQLHPRLILSTSTPSGGDMGAHVWGPAYLRDHLLPHLRLSGWTPDWYAGFPAYQFYMVLPSLMIVALNVGFTGPLVVVPLLVACGLVVLARRHEVQWQRRAAYWVAGAILVLGISIPYGTAFKLVTVSGVLTLPLAAYAFGRLARLPFPTPALLAVATLPFLFYRGFTIYGGNIASTLAGEFAFSISLTFGVLYLGVVVRGLETGEHRALAAVLLALTGLCHLIPAFYVLAATPLALALRPGVARVKWLLAVLPVGGLISAFWVMPFFWQRSYLNDMGWEKLPHTGESYWKYLLPHDLQWVAALAVVGAVLSIAFWSRAGVLLALNIVVFALAFRFIPEARLWNARLLPFYYLSMFLLAAVGFSEVCRSLALLFSPHPDRPPMSFGVVTTLGGLGAVLFTVALPLHTLPFGKNDAASGAYEWAMFATQDNSFIDDWARWNYSGYEGKDYYPEYRALVLEMAAIGKEHGCGRSFWEYEKELDRYGTPMALMLLPHWTDGCIGSMEGLYFEASSTTPFHFLMQSELSSAPSSAQRDLPYRGFDMTKGVEHLQLMGVKYYLATSAQAITAARANADLTELATSGPWAIFEVKDAPVVEALDHEPVVLQGVSDHQTDWLDGNKNTKDASTDNDRANGPSVRFFQDSSRWDTFLSQGGPSTWRHLSGDDALQASAKQITPAKVTNVDVGRDAISFDVDRVGAPVLVKVSYFPNWHASGATGPYRVSPNLMLVVPTSKHVSLSYGREPIDLLSIALSIFGIALAVFLARRPPLEMPVPTRREIVHDEVPVDDSEAAPWEERTPVVEVGAEDP